jgi:hypothetical protein
MKRILSLLLLLVLLIPVFGARSKRPPAEWSDTKPAVNLTHIFHGEINKRGKPVGFHARPDGRDPNGSGVKAVLSPANKQGVYVARVWVASPRKTKMSTFFPDSLDRAGVIRAILNAHRKGRFKGGRFSGPSGHGFTIEGYLLGDGRINTAYPVYRR